MQKFAESFERNWKKDEIELLRSHKFAVGAAAYMLLMAPVGLIGHMIGSSAIVNIAAIVAIVAGIAGLQAIAIGRLFK